MNSWAPGAAAVRRSDSIADEIQSVYGEISRRTHERSRKRRQATLSMEDWLEDWLLAERELLIKPSARIDCSGTRMEITFDLKGIPPTSLEVVVSPSTVLVHSPKSPAYPKIFRSLDLSTPIDARYAEARFEDEGLVVKADLQM